MDIRTNSICFSGRWNICQRLSKRWAKIHQSPQTDTFTRTTRSAALDYKNIKIGEFINQGREAEVYKTNNENYVLRIVKGYNFIPEEMIPVEDGNGLIIAKNSDDTVQILKYIKGEPLYDKKWNIINSSLTKDEYLETFNKIKNLPDESFAEYIRKLVNLRKKGYDNDSINPNNILLDGTHLNIVDIFKMPTSKTTLFIGDFDQLVNAMHIEKYLKEMDRTELNSFADEIKILYDRIIKIAKKEGHHLNIKTTPHPEIYNLYYKNWEQLERYLNRWKK